MKLAPVALSALAISLAACSSTGKEAAPAAVAALPDGLDYPLTPAGAAAFVAETEAELEELWTLENRAGWVNETNITEDTDALVSWVGGMATEKRVEFALKAARYAEVDGLDSDVERKLTLLRTEITTPAPTTPGAADEAARLKTALGSAYSTGSGTLNGETLKGNELEVQMGNLDLGPEDYAEMWSTWHTTTGAPMKDNYRQLVELMNAGAQELGFADFGAMQRSKYDMDPDAFAAETERLWQEVKPLYVALHTYVRSELSDHYGEDVQPDSGPIRADLLGNMWAQQWSSIYPIVAPEGTGEVGYDLTSLIEAKGMDERDMVKAGENFFSSLGFDPLPDTFWTRSQFTRPEGRDVVCHASAWDVENSDDIRIKMCINRNAEDFVVIHHELGHNYYQRAYGVQDMLYRDSANDGFHEAIGDLIALSITPEYLVQIGLLDEGDVPSADADTGLLLAQALDRVAFMPFGLLVDRWRWGVADGSTTPAEYNEDWTRLRLEYQGITPPVARPADAFDPGAKYHVPNNVSYTRYFLAHILMFQFYKAACDQSGWEGPLHRCSFYDNKEVGAKLEEMLAMGRSKSWPEALETFTGQREMSGEAFLEYFAPLKAWLDEQNEGKPQGW